MIKKPALQPPVFDRRPTPEATINVDDGRFAAAEAIETTEGVARRVATGSVRALNLDTSDIGPRRLAAKRQKEVALSTTIPESVKTVLRKRYAETGTTIRVQILLALRAQGIPVDEEDLHDDRKRR